MKSFMKSGHTPTLFSAFLYFDVSFMVWVLLGVLGIYIAKDFGLDATQKGFMVAVPILGGSLLRIIIGLMADHIGTKRTGIIAQMLVVIPLAGIWLFAKNFHTVLSYGFLLGIAGASFAVALPLASRWYPKEHQGMALGIAGAGNSGTVLASLFAPRLAEHFGWHHVFGLALIPVVLTLIFFSIFAKDSPAQPKPQKLSSYLKILKEKDTFWFSFFYSITFGGFVGLASFLGIFFHDQYHVSKVMAGNLTAACVFAGSFFRPVGGYWADRLGGIHMLSILYGLIAVLMFAAGFLPPLYFITVLIFLGLAMLGMGNGAVFQLVPLRFQKEIGVITGIVGAAGGLGGFFLPTFLGFLKDRTGSYGSGFMLFSFANLSALILLRMVQKGWSFPKIFSEVKELETPIAVEREQSVS